jgi:hypothetical protein
MPQSEDLDLGKEIMDVRNDVQQVAIVMMFLLGNILGGLIAMIPNLFPMIILFDVVGLTERPLDSDR